VRHSAAELSHIVADDGHDRGSLEQVPLIKAKGWPHDPATAAHGRSRIYRLDKQPGTPL